MKLPFTREMRCAALAALLAIASATPALAENSNQDGDDPVVDNSRTSQALQKLPRKPIADRLAVTIYEFRSSVAEVTPAAAADMFITALVNSGQFRVVERAQLNETVMREKQINGAGQSTGIAAQKQLRGAQYIFEGTVSEANAAEDQSQGGINIGGLTVGGSRNADTIAIDVRILDAETGDVLDSVAVRKVLKASSRSLGGTAAFAGTVASLFGKEVSPLTPDVNVQSSRKEGVDKALRSCIDASVLELIKRLPSASVASNES